MKSLLTIISLGALLTLPAAAQRGQCDGTGPKGRGQGQGQCCGQCQRQSAQRGMRGGARGPMRGGMRHNQAPPAAQEKK